MFMADMAQHHQTGLGWRPPQKKIRLMLLMLGLGGGWCVIPVWWAGGGGGLVRTPTESNDGVQPLDSC